MQERISIGFFIVGLCTVEKGVATIESSEPEMMSTRQRVLFDQQMLIVWFFPSKQERFILLSFHSVLLRSIRSHLGSDLSCIRFC
mmetsp:Transcript_115338/g.235811  ORF Transcript_115338/g.235811 Transcript_115338/m.235811 type:complete len:85 (-) Transcript_115338:316-570(-)